MVAVDHGRPRGRGAGRWIDDVRPDVVVTLDGSDGHRDHVAIRDATLAAVRTAAHRPARTYLSCLAPPAMDRWADHLRGVDR